MDFTGLPGSMPMTLTTDGRWLQGADADRPGVSMAAIAVVAVIAFLLLR